MLMMLTSGLILGMFLDFVRVCRERYPFRKRLQPFVDILYWLLSAILVFGLLWWSNWGELRFYIFVAICLGFLIYFQYLSKSIRESIRRILQFMEWLIRFIVRLLDTLVFKPVVKLWTIVRAIFGLFFTPISLTIKWLRSKFNNKREKK